MKTSSLVGDVQVVWGNGGGDCLWLSVPFMHYHYIPAICCVECQFKSDAVRSIAFV